MGIPLLVLDVDVAHVVLHHSTRNAQLVRMLGSVELVLEVVLVGILVMLLVEILVDLG